MEIAKLSTYRTMMQVTYNNNKTTIIHIQRTEKEQLVTSNDTKHKVSIKFKTIVYSCLDCFNTYISH